MVALFDFTQDNVALIVVLEARDTGTIVDSQATSGKRGQLLCVVRVFPFDIHSPSTFVRVGAAFILTSSSSKN